MSGTIALPPRVLLSGLGPPKPISDPEFVIAGIQPKGPGPYVREIYGRLVYVGFAQIFRSTDPTDPHRARSRIEANLRLALNWGVQKMETVGGCILRLTAGLECLEEFVGAPIDPAFLRLAILRPMEVHRHEATKPSPEERAKAAELGVELVPTPAYFEVVTEVGLDVMPRRRRE